MKRFLAAYGEQCPGLFTKYLTLEDVAADLATRWPYFHPDSITILDALGVGEITEEVSSFYELIVRLKGADEPRT
jgi:hypothetical protein